MDKRVFIAAALSVLILIAWSYVFPPPRRPEPQPGPQPDQPVVENVENVENVGDVEPAPPPAPADVEPEEPVELTEAVGAESVRDIAIENEMFELTLTNRGGVVTSWKLVDETTGNEPLELLPRFGEENARTLAVEVDDSALTGQLNEALYEVERVTLSDGERVVFTWADGRGVEVRKTLTLPDHSYLAHVDVEVRDRGRRLPTRLLLGPGFGEQVGGNGKSHGTYYYQAVVWNRSGQVTHRKKNKVDEPEGLAGGIRWAGLEDQYFAALILPDEPAERIGWRGVELVASAGGDEGESEPEDYPVVAVSVPESGARLYVGPKKYGLLQALGSELEKVVWFSSSAFLAWISRFIFFCLLWIHDHTIANYGMAIVVTTFLLRLVLFPVNQYSMVSMKKTQLQMQKLQPKIKAIRNKYKKSKDSESRAKMNQDMMDLYKREGVNPMGGISGCLPLLAQFPILMGFYFMLTVTVELRGAPFFGWITDLSVKDPYWITPLLMGATMFMQQRMAMSRIKDPVQQQQQKFMMFMPFIFTYICLQMPAGMVLYWFVNNLLGIGQQWLVNRHTTRLEAAEQKA